MEYFLPIAEVYVNLPLIFILSLVVGVLSGLFGVGGGFLMTPFLIFLGVPPAYAVPNEANNILGTSISGSTTHYLKGTLDYKMGFMIVIGGAAGTILGIITFSYFQDIGKINIVISLSYMYILAIIGTIMLVQGVTEIDRARRKIILKKKLHYHYWPCSRIYSCNNGCRWCIYSSSSNDLYNWNANKINSWYIFICYYFC